MSLGIVNELKIIDITHDNSKGFINLIIDFLLKFFLIFTISSDVSRACEAVTSGHLICHR